MLHADRKWKKNVGRSTKRSTGTGNSNRYTVMRVLYHYFLERATENHVTAFFNNRVSDTAAEVITLSLLQSRYFNAIKNKSFMRQLNSNGFQRV